MCTRNKKGQSTVEYILLMTAVVAVIILMVTSNKSGLQGQLNQTLNSAIEDIGNMSDRLAGSQVTSTTSNTANPVTLNVVP